MLRDKGGKTIFLMSAENLMDPGEILGYLLELSVVEEIIITYTYVQMTVFRERGY